MDIVERLRLWEADKWRDPIHKDAADEIERLREGRDTMGNLWAKEKAEIERLRSYLPKYYGKAWHRFWYSCIDVRDL